MSIQRGPTGATLLRRGGFANTTFGILMLELARQTKTPMPQELSPTETMPR